MKNRDRDVFPATRRTWIAERLSEGDAGRSEVLQHVMSVYAKPLAVYFRGSSFNRLGEPLDWVHAFFANRLARQGYLEQWRESGDRLRRWLTLGFCFFLKDAFEKERRRSGWQPLDASAMASPEPGPLRALESAYVARLTELALESAEAKCLEDGLELHWRVFQEHRVDGCPYREIAERLGVGPVRAATMARTAGKRFNAALQELLLRDGVPPEHLRGVMQELVEARRA